TASELQQLRAEAEREDQHPHTDPPGHEEMPELVHEYQHPENEDEPAQIEDGVNDAHAKTPAITRPSILNRGRGLRRTRASLHQPSGRPRRSGHPARTRPRTPPSRPQSAREWP